MIKRFILLLIAVSFVSVPASATDWFTGQTQSGSGNALSWANKSSISGIPWGSIAPGDTLYVDCGTVTSTITTAMTIGAGGSAGNLIRIRAGQDAGHNGVCEFEGGGGTTARIAIGSRNYIWIDGEYIGTRHFKFQNNTQTGNSPLITGFGNASTTGLGNRFSYIEVVKSGVGVSLLYQKQGIFEYSWIHDISCDVALDLDGSAFNDNAYGMGVEVHHNILQANNSSNAASADAPDVIQATHGITAHHNTIMGAVGTLCAGPNHQDGIQQGGNHYIMYDNFFYNLRNSHTDSDWGGNPCGFLHVWNNVFSQNNQGAPAAIWVGAQGACATVTDVLIINNSFVDFPASGPPTLYLQHGGGVNVTASRIQNNIFYNTDHPFQIDGTFVCEVGLIVSNNNINAGAGGGTTYTCSVEPGHQAGAPTFTTYAQFGTSSNNYQITGASMPDIGTGVNLTSLGFTSLNSDINSVARASSGAWDIGAYTISDIPPPPTPVTPNAIGGGIIIQ